MQLYFIHLGKFPMQFFHYFHFNLTDSICGENHFQNISYIFFQEYTESPGKRDAIIWEVVM